MKKNILSVLLLFICAAQSTAQTAALPPGAKVPDLVFRQMLNYPSKQLRLADLKGKVVILDFWFTGCSTCLHQFPRMKALQDSFGNKLAIITVGFNAGQQGSIERFVKARVGTPRAVPLPVAVEEDTAIIRQLFPATAFPHEIWIDPQGNFINATDHYAVSANNISSLLAGQPVSFTPHPLKKKIRACTPFLLDIESTTGSIRYGSVLAGFRDTLVKTAPFGMQCDLHITRLFEVNASVYTLYKEVFNRPEFFESYAGRFILEPGKTGIFADENDFVNPDDKTMNKHRRETMFCYELVLPSTVSVANAREYMRADLDRYLGIKSSIEQREVPCLVLQPIKDTLQWASKATAYNSTMKASEDYLEFAITGKTVGSLTTYLGNVLPKELIIDETGYKGRLDMVIHLNEKSITALNAQLEKYGMRLIRAKRTMDMIVLRKL